MTGLVDVFIEAQKVALEAELLSLFKGIRALRGELLPNLTTDDKLKIVNGFVATIRSVADQIQSVCRGLAIAGSPAAMAKVESVLGHKI